MCRSADRLNGLRDFSTDSIYVAASISKRTMILNREIGMETRTFVSNRLPVMLQIIIIYIACFSMIAAPAVSYPKANEKEFDTYVIKNRNNSDSYNGNQNDTIEYNRPLIYRDLFMKPYSSRKMATRNFPEAETSDTYITKNRMSNRAGIRRSFDRAGGMTRILTFPLKGRHRGIINGFKNGDPAAECLTGGLDAGVVNGALKIGIGVGLAPGCAKTEIHKKQPPKLVPMPIFIPRPVPVPVGVPQPYLIDVPRPVPFSLPFPFPSMDMGSPPMLGGGHQFYSDDMKSRIVCLFQRCGQSLDTIKAPTEKYMDEEYRDVTEINESAENTITPDSHSIMYRSLKSKNKTN